MFLLNLSLPEFLALLGSLSGAVVALYLLDRLRKKHTVPTLRFFAATEKQPVLKHRRRLQQPWSLLLQLISLALLLLAIAQLRFGSPDRSSRDHVLILDTSAWMNARVGQSRLIDQARTAARNYLRLIPAGDRVMVVRADVLATPATLFESSRAKIQQAIDLTQPGAGPLDIQQALQFAEQSQRLHAQHPGEIVFVGSGRISADESAPAPPTNLRVIPVTGPTEHSGLRKVGVRRSQASPDGWDVFVAVKNYGAKPRSVPLVVQFGGAPVGTHRFQLNPGAEESASFQFKTGAAGWLDARILTGDAFSQDARAVLELPSRKLLTVAVYSDEPDLLKPVFHAIPGVQATFVPTAGYDSRATAGIVLLDRFVPAQPPRVPSIWLEPPAANSPVPVRTTIANVKLKQWRSGHALTAGLRAKDLQIDSAEILRAGANDVAIAESDAGPLIVARDGQSKMVVFGFHPVRSALKYELTTPLLFANMLRWMQPEILRSWESTAGTVGAVNVDLESEGDPAAIQVVTESGQKLPFTVDGRSLRFFSAAPGLVRVLTGGREMVYSLTLPQPGDMVWKPANVRYGLPRRAPAERSSRDLWQWLALLGGAGLFIDWLVYGRMQHRIIPASAAARRLPWRKAS
jgi:VWA domain-containing protein/aerotolerance regulator-like protein